MTATATPIKVASLRKGRSYAARRGAAAAHAGHGGITWEGRTNGHTRGRCDGCGDTIFGIADGDLATIR